jgi:DNA invertase Pin-like site-specific DNA recombinase
MSMSQSINQKVTSSHLKRQAYCYVRQSTLKQVFENTESTKRQYALRDRAIALGWPVVQIVTVDSDLGETATSVADRQGFQKLMTEVSLGRVGLVMGLEVSRLARNNADWARLLEICAITDTLILDEEGIYNPTDFNDRLLLNMKGTFSEVELHVLRSRLRGGILSKALPDLSTITMTKSLLIRTNKFSIVSVYFLIFFNGPAQHLQPQRPLPMMM